MKAITKTCHQRLMDRLKAQPLLQEEILGLGELYERYEDILAEMAELIEDYDRLQLQALQQEARLRRGSMGMDNTLYHLNKSYGKERRQTAVRPEAG